MYNLQDKTYRGQPPVMTEEVTRIAAKKIYEHASEMSESKVHVILHGGEPLLMGKKRFSKWVKIVRSEFDGKIVPFFSVQSNGTLVDEEWVEVLADNRVGIGISVDGPKLIHDKFRVDQKGSGTFEEVVKGIRILQSHPRGSEVFSTVMAVVNTDISPKELFDFWNFLNVQGFDLTLPHANHLYKPPKGIFSYGDWMVRFFDLWFEQNRQDRRIRYFDNMLRMIFEYPLSTDNIGGKPVGVVVVETDGGIEPTDAFKCCADSITKLGANVRTHDFSNIQSIEMVKTLQVGANSLCKTCKSCEVLKVCGGGYMPHRFDPANGFNNPSVYCDDLYQIITHIRERVVSTLPKDLALRVGVN